MSRPNGNEEIQSPFAAARTTLSTPSSQKKSKKSGIFVALAAVSIVVIGAGIFSFKYLNDPYRKLEEFPVSRYFESHKTLAGLKFRSDLRVEADLGWKEGIGRLMVFTPMGESRQLAVFIPPSLSTVFFNKGQNYTVELEVKDGGLIYADSCRKN
jgi:hypothetical protein